MTAVATTPQAGLTPQELAMLFQYTVEAYKVFEKLAENLPNPMTRAMFAQFAVDEREDRDLIEMKAASIGGRGVRVIGLCRFSASFSNVLYASTVYWRRRARFCAVRVVVWVSTAVICTPGCRVARLSGCLVCLITRQPDNPTTPHSIFATFTTTSPINFA